MNWYYSMNHREIGRIGEIVGMAWDLCRFDRGVGGVGLNEE